METFILISIPVFIVSIFVVIGYIIMHIHCIENQNIELRESLSDTKTNITAILTILSNVYTKACDNSDTCDDFKQYKCPYAEKMLKNADAKSTDTASKRSGKQ